MFDARYEQRIAYNTGRLCVAGSGDAERRQNAAAYYVRPSKMNPTRRSGLVLKREKEVYRREEYLSVAYRRRVWSYSEVRNHRNDPHKSDLI